MVTVFHVCFWTKQNIQKKSFLSPQIRHCRASYPFKITCMKLNKNRKDNKTLATVTSSWYSWWGCTMYQIETCDNNRHMFQMVISEEPVEYWVSALILRLTTQAAVMRLSLSETSAIWCKNTNWKVEAYVKGYPVRSNDNEMIISCSDKSRYLYILTILLKQFFMIIHRAIALHSVQWPSLI